jgi:DNA-binding NarL/FixJ family response regulator
MIASARPDLADALLATLECEQDFRITGYPIADPAPLLSYLERQRPDLLLLEKRLLDRLGIQSTRTIHAGFPDMRVLLLCDRVHTGLVEVIVRHHFHGFLPTSCAPDTCVKAIQTVMQGELWLPRAFLEKAIFQPALATDHDNPMVAIEPILTRREGQAVGYLCQGFTNKQIGSKLGIREDTVKKHLHNVYGKLGVRCRTQLMARQGEQ